MKLLIIEDDPIISETVTICFNLRWPEAEVIATDSGEEGVKLAETESPDVVILDVGLPGMDGYETLRRLRDISDIPAIMLTARDTEVAKVKGLEWGADDYITKPFSHIELLARVRAVLRRGSASSSAGPQEGYRNEAAGLDIDLDSRVVTRHGEQINLAPLEYSLLFHLISNEGRVIPHQTLLAKVWGREYVDEVDYLKVYIRRLRTKLNDDPQNPELIHTERGVGYIFQVRARSGPSPATAKVESAAEQAS
ncbi:MAG TPA: response regulator transcription factor [Dehalococcoidia bacterium]|nr:response regulator transcription factor [Dehalococcoidia bacterium]